MSTVDRTILVTLGGSLLVGSPRSACRHFVCSIWLLARVQMANSCAPGISRYIVKMCFRLAYWWLDFELQSGFWNVAEPTVVVICSVTDAIRICTNNYPLRLAVGCILNED